MAGFTNFWMYAIMLDISDLSEKGLSSRQSGYGACGQTDMAGDMKFCPVY
jgi:hypothetical protein